MRSHDCRSVLIILSLFLASFAASAQNSPLMLRSSNQLNQSSQRPGAEAAPVAAPSSAPLTGNSMGRLPDALIEGMVLDAAQKAKLEAAHEARRKICLLYTSPSPRD